MPLDLIVRMRDLVRAARKSEESFWKSKRRALFASTRLRYVGLTCQHTNQTILVEGPEITIRPVGTRRLVAGGAR